MKLLNVLSIACLYLILSACSMENDTIMNDVDKENHTYTESYVSFNMNLNGDGATKSSSSKPEESTPQAPGSAEGNIATCFLAIFNAESKQLITSYYYGENTGDIKVDGSNGVTSLGQHLTFKVKEVESVKPDLIFVAIANVNLPSQYGDAASSLKTLESCKTYDALMQARIIENPTVLVKVGEKRVKGTEYTTSSSLDNPDSYLTTIHIPVSQRSASVELAKFSIKNHNTDNVTTDLTSEVSDIQVNLRNINLYTKVGGNDSGVEDTGYSPVKFEKGKQQSPLYTYPNSTAQKTTLTISYQFKGEQKYAAYTIKTPTTANSLGYTEEVRANTLYKLYVTIINEVVDVTVKCYTLDWEKNEINMEL
jgi:hypothetical protein